MARQITNLVHSTLKSMLDKKKNINAFKKTDINIDWETFKDFNNTQFLGLLVLKPECLEELKSFYDSRIKEISTILALFKPFLESITN
jgi:hypothetical protein